MIDAGGDNEFVTALLNSNVAHFHFKSVFVLKAGGFFEIQPDGLSSFPVPHAKPKQKADLCKRAKAAQSAMEKNLELKKNFTRRIPDLCPSEREPKVNKKLKEWWLLPDFAAFRAEIKKCFKAEIPLNERTDWEDWIARDKAEIHRLSGEIAKLEAEINKQVYALFDLTDEEITLLEANI